MSKEKPSFKKTLTMGLHVRNKKIAKNSYDEGTGEPVVVIFKTKDDNLGFTLKGNRVNNIIPGSEAEKKGVERGWSIVTINGVKQSLRQTHILNSLEDAKKFDKDIVIKFWTCGHRNSTDEKFTTNTLQTSDPRGSSVRRSYSDIDLVGFHPSGEVRSVILNSKDSLGFTLDKNIVVDVSPGTNAEKAGIESGWTVVTVNGAPTDEKSIYHILEKAKQSDENVKIDFWAKPDRFPNDSNTFFDSWSLTVPSDDIPSMFRASTISGFFRRKSGSTSLTISGGTDLDIYNRKMEEKKIESKVTKRKGSIITDNEALSPTICRNCRHESCDWCQILFSAFVWKHHCAKCAKAFCKKCSRGNQCIPCLNQSTGRIKPPLRRTKHVSLSLLKNDELLYEIESFTEKVSLSSTSRNSSISARDSLLSSIRTGKKLKKIGEYSSQSSRLIELEFEHGPLGIDFQGNTICGVDKNSQAYEADLCVGWQIIEVDGKKVNDENDILQTINKANDANEKFSILFQKPNLKQINFEPKIIGIQFLGNTIYQVTQHSQADENGVRIGWVIVEVNGKVQPNNQTIILEAINNAKEQKDSIEILFWKAITRVVKFKAGDIGMKFYKNTVHEVVPNSQAHKAGVRAGWLMLSINGKKADNENNIVKAVRKTEQTGKSIVVRFRET